MCRKGCSCSLVVLASMNVVTMLVAFLIVTWGLYLLAMPSTACNRLVQLPIFASGVFLFVISFMGLVGACCRVSCILWLYLTVLFLLIIALTCFTAFAFLVTNKSASAAVSANGYHGYHLSDYSRFLKMMVNKDGSWEAIQSCLKAGRVCGGAPLAAIPMDPTDLYKARLTSIQTGCCKPPPGCGHAAAASSTTTVLVNPDRLLLTDLQQQMDCKSWSSDPVELCFACESCKAGFLDNIQKDWKLLAVFNVGLLLLLVFVYCVGCCAARSSRRDNYQRYIGGYRT